MRESVLFDLEHFIIELSGSCLRAARIIIILMMDKLNLITSLTTDWCIDWTGEGAYFWMDNNDYCKTQLLSYQLSARAGNDAEGSEACVR